ncbi:MAG TPA: hypothetical protein VFG69_21020 [Nannocystaceae bacterium]|nr:hypothetical protein [Nannocystaceae bacterium]
MSAPSSQRQRWLTLGVTLGVSVVAHLLLWPLSAVFIGGGGSSRVPPAGGVMEVALLDPDEAEREPDPEDLRPLYDDEGKLVQLDRVLDERPPEVDTEHLSEFDSRTAHETRAPNQRPQPGGPPQIRGDRPDGRSGESRESQRSDATSTAKALALLPGASAGDSASDAKDDNPLGTTSELPRAGGKLGSLSPAGSPGTREALRKSLGQPGSFDDLDDSIEEGNETILNSKRWKFASFFNRVRNGVANHWHPEVVHAARDPDGTVYGTKTRRTKLVISLNADGSLHGVHFDAGGESGVDYLDEEAIRAVRAAAPFANPPPGLVGKNGKIEFGFGFIFEIHGGTRIFRYQR